MTSWRFIALALAVCSSCLLVERAAYESAAAEPASEVAQAETCDLQVVTYGSGLTGFFDSQARKLYLYGADLKTPFMTVQIEKLGEPLKLIAGPPEANKQ